MKPIEQFLNLCSINWRLKGQLPRQASPALKGRHVKKGRSLHVLYLLVWCGKCSAAGFKGLSLLFPCSQPAHGKATRFGYFTRWVPADWVFHYRLKITSNEISLNISSHAEYPQHLHSQGGEIVLPPSASFTPSMLILNSQNGPTPQIFVWGHIVCHKAYLN